MFKNQEQIERAARISQTEWEKQLDLFLNLQKGPLDLLQRAARYLKNIEEQQTKALEL